MSCEKSLLTTQWYLKRIDRRDAQNEEILKRIARGSETKAINLSTLLQNNPKTPSLYESKDWGSESINIFI